MTEYRWDRRIDPTPPLHPITKNEALEASDLRREKAYLRAREALADERREQQKAGLTRRFADALAKAKR